MAQITSIINWKGGVGKTTFTHHIGTGLTHLNWSENFIPKILLIDLDPQCNLSISCLHEDTFEDLIFKQKIPTIKDVLTMFFMEDSPAIKPTDYILKNCIRKNMDHDNILYYENIDLITSHPDLIFTDMDISQLSRPSYQDSLLTRDIYKFKFLDNFLSLIKTDYDFIFIDCPPNLNFITQNALYSSDFYLIPTILDKLSTYGILSITNKINGLNTTFSQIDTSYSSTELLGIVANDVIEYNGAPKASQSNRLVYLRNIYKDKVFEDYLTHGDGISTSSINSFPVYSLNTPNAVKQASSLLQITLLIAEKLLTNE